MPLADVAEAVLAIVRIEYVPVLAIDDIVTAENPAAVDTTVDPTTTYGCVRVFVDSVLVPGLDESTMLVDPTDYEPYT